MPEQTAQDLRVLTDESYRTCRYSAPFSICFLKHKHELNLCRVLAKGMEGRRASGLALHNLFIHHVYLVAVILFLLGKNRQSRPSQNSKWNEAHMLFSALPLLISIAFRCRWDPC